MPPKKAEKVPKASAEDGALPIPSSLVVCAIVVYWLIFSPLSVGTAMILEYLRMNRSSLFGIFGYTASN